jgi:hypothetical protein
MQSDHVIFLHSANYAGPCIYIPQGEGGPDIPPGTGFPFLVSYNSQGYGGGILSRLHKGVDCSLKLKLNYDRQSVGQSVLVSGTHLGPVTPYLCPPGTGWPRYGFASPDIDSARSQQRISFPTSSLSMLA